MCSIYEHCSLQLVSLLAKYYCFWIYDPWPYKELCPNWGVCVMMSCHHLCNDTRYAYA